MMLLSYYNEEGHLGEKIVCEHLASGTVSKIVLLSSDNGCTKLGGGKEANNNNCDEDYRRVQCSAFLLLFYFFTIYPYILFIFLFYFRV